MSRHSPGRLAAVGLGLGLAALAATARAQTDPVPQPPQPRKLELTRPGEGFPPRVRGMEQVRAVPWTPIPRRLTPEMETGIRQAAVRGARVREQLGSRFAYIETMELDPRKGRPAGTGPIETSVTFYSYTNNTAVEVRMRGTEILGVEKRPGYQPPEGPEEADTAIRLAREDARLRGSVRELAAWVIQTPAPEGSAERGHRIFYVAFSKPGSLHPQYAAAVDLTTGKVLAAGIPKKGR